MNAYLYARPDSGFISFSSTAFSTQVISYLPVRNSLASLMNSCHFTKRKHLRSQTRKLHEYLFQFLPDIAVPEESVYFQNSKAVDGEVHACDALTQKRLCQFLPQA